MPQSVRKGPDGAFYVAELPHRVTVLGRDGTLIARWGDGVEVDDADGGAGARPARCSGPAFGRSRPGAHRPRRRAVRAPHGIAVDSAGSFYVAEAAESWAGLDRGSRSIQKFVRR